MDLGNLALQATGSQLAVLFFFSFLPPVVFAVWIRNTELYGREPWVAVARAFLWGALVAVLIGFILEVILVFLFEQSGFVYSVLARRFSDPSAIVLALVIAPFVEEFTKAWGVWHGRRVIREPEDGLVYGATTGLGFSATENLLYGIWALYIAGIGASLFLIAVRSVSSSLLHASATSLTGEAIARQHLWGPRFSILPWYLAAVMMHAAFNGLASIGESFAATYGDAGALLILAAAVVFALAAVSVVRGKIRAGEGRGAWAR